MVLLMTFCCRLRLLQSGLSRPLHPVPSKASTSGDTLYESEDAAELQQRDGQGASQEDAQATRNLAGAHNPDTVPGSWCA